MKSTLRIIAVNLALLLTAVLVFELAMGKWFATDSLKDLDVPVGQVRHHDASHLYPGGGIVEWRRDSYGLRGRFGTPENVDILAIGGSTTNEIYVAAGETWTDRLGEMLSRPGRPVGVANAGIDAQTTWGHIVAVERWLSRIPGLKPRFVIAYVGVNDMARAQPLRYQDDMEVAGFKERLLRRLRNNSALYDVYRRLSGLWRAHVAQVVYAGGDEGASERYRALPVRVVDGPRPDEEALARELAPLLAAYDQRLLTLIDRIEAMGAKAVIVSQRRAEVLPTADGRWQVKGQGDIGNLLRGEAIMAHYARQAMRSCAAAQAICLDLNAELAFTHDDFFDMVHTTPSGSFKIARYIADRLAPHFAGE